MQAVIAALAASALSFAVLYLLLSRRIRKLVDPEAIVAQIRREIEELIAELNHTAERNITLMEAKIASLAGVLQKAERRIALLRREASALEQSERAYAALRSAPPEAPRSEAGAKAGEGARPEPRLEGSVRERPTRARRARTTESELEREVPDEAEVRERILTLHRAGISPDSICRKVRVPRAKVDLIVALEEEST